MYHPRAEGSNDGDLYEFIELKNCGTEVVDLSGARLDGGIRFAFAEGTVVAPGAFVVLVADATAFEAPPATAAADRRR